ncbi:hypothetical protein Tco_0635527 [Tanacetum coccineum]
MITFPLSLSGKERKLWMNKGDGKINTWEELVNKFFSEFYPLSCASNYDKMCVDDEEGLDPLEFITWRNSKFKDHKKVDETTKRALIYSWIEVGNNEGLIDEDISKVLLPKTHTGKVLEIIEWIKIPNVDKYELRLHAFSKSLSGDAKKWRENEGKQYHLEGFEPYGVSQGLGYGVLILDLTLRKIDDMVLGLVQVKTVNGEVQLQALVDGKKIIVTDSIMRRDLQLEDTEGVDCLPNAIIFEQLTLMGYEKVLQKLTFYKAFFSQQWKFLIHTILQCLSAKTTTWNEFSSTMASAIICLATSQNYIRPFGCHVTILNTIDHLGKFDGKSHEGFLVGYSLQSKAFRVYNLETKRVEENPHITFLENKPNVAGNHTPTIIQSSTSKPQKTQKPRRSKRKDTKVPQPSGPTTNVADEAINEEMGDSLERGATIATGLEAEQDSGNIDKTQSKATLNEPSSSGFSSGSGPRRQETMGDTIAHTRSENVSKLSMIQYSQESSCKSSCLETTKTQLKKLDITSLKRRVKKLERRNNSRTRRLKRLYKVGSSRRVESSEDEGLGEEDASKQGRIVDIHADEDIYLVNVQTDEDMFIGEIVD